MQKIAETSDALIAWETLPDGHRIGWWCKICRDEGKQWVWPQCQHVEQAQPQIEIPREAAKEIMVEYMDQEARELHHPA